MKGDPKGGRSLLFEISDTSKLMMKLELFVCVPNYLRAIATVAHTWQHAPQSRMGAKTVVIIPAAHGLPCDVGFFLLRHK